MPSAHNLPFLAPIPHGHDVLVATFAIQDTAVTLVLDRTASNLYCPEALWGPLHQDPVRAVMDPIAVVTRFAWVVQSTIEGVCVGSLTSTDNTGNRHQAQTMLLLEPAAAAPYR